MDKLNEQIMLIKNSGLFDEHWYLMQYADVMMAGIDPIKHYLKYGAILGRNPTITFDTTSYLESNSDVKKADINPFCHYIMHGKGEGRSSVPDAVRINVDESIMSSIEIYDTGNLEISDESEAIQNESTAANDTQVNDSFDASNIELSYLKEELSPKFDATYYLASNPDVKEAGINPLVHYIQFGQKEGRQAFPPEQQEELKLMEIIKNSGYFDSEYYCFRYPDISESSIDPIWHYLYYGYKEGRDPSKYFKTTWYIENNPDIRSANINPLVHYLLYGKNEGRRTSPTFIDKYKVAFDLRSENVPLTVPVKSRNNGVVDLSLAVHIHCHFMEVFHEIIQIVSEFPARTEVFVSVTSDTKQKLVREAAQEYGVELNKVVTVPNRGRDIAPMIVEFGEDLLNSEVAVHLHTKKSVEKEDFGREWKADILKCLFFNRNYISNILKTFNDNESIGALYPDPFRKIIPFMKMGKNKKLLESVLSKLSIYPDSVDEETLDFPAGSMFWFRPKSLKPLLRAGYTYDDFPKEPIPDDGTLAHAIERSFTYVIENSGYCKKDIRPFRYEKSWPNNLPKKVSVIIPVYNAERWLDKTIESVLWQDSAHIPFEIICVDNNSTDDSKRIIKMYESLYDNVISVTKLEQGAGNARNKGLEVSSGDYVMFLDADDILPTDAISKLYFPFVEFSDIDMTVGSLIVYDEENTSHAIPYGDSNDNVLVMSTLDYEKKEQTLKKVFSDFGACAKLYRKNFLTENSIRFPENTNFEDNVFVYKAYLNAKDIGVLNTVCYFYRKYKEVQGGTQSTVVKDDALIDQLDIVTTLLEKFLLDIDESKKKIFIDSLITKIGWEFDRFPQVEICIAALEKYDMILKLIDKELCWNMLGARSEEIKNHFMQKKF